MVGDDLRRWVHSDTESVGFQRDYTSEREPPEAVLDLRVEPLDRSLACVLFDGPQLPGADQMYLDRRREIWESGADGGYVAIDDRGRPAYLQFYIPHEQLDLVHRLWGGLFPDYGPDSLLCEGAWVPPEFRGRGLMAQGMYLTSMAAKAESPNTVRYSQTYVQCGNHGAIAGCQAAGFDVFQRRIERWRFGRQSFEFQDAR